MKKIVIIGANDFQRPLIQKAHEMGVKNGHDPFITLSFMALPVIPQIRITPRGVFDVDGWSFL